MAGVVFGDLVAGGSSPHSHEWLINLVSLWRSPCIQMWRPLSSVLLPRLKENTVFAARYLEGLPGDDACWVWAWVIFKSISAAFGGFMEFLTVVSVVFSQRISACLGRMRLRVKGRAWPDCWQFSLLLPLRCCQRSLLSASIIGRHVIRLRCACLPLSSFIGTAFSDIHPKASEKNPHRKQCGVCQAPGYTYGEFQGCRGTLPSWNQRLVPPYVLTSLLVLESRWSEFRWPPC